MRAEKKRRLRGGGKSPRGSRPAQPTPSIPCALTRGLSMKASSPLSQLGSLRVEIRSPKQGSTKSPLLGDKGSSPDTSTPGIPPGSPPPTASPSLYSVTLPTPLLTRLWQSRSPAPSSQPLLPNMWLVSADPLGCLGSTHTHGAPQGRTPCLPPWQTQLKAIRTTGSISLARA